MMDVRNISSKMDEMNIGVSQARGDDRSPEEVLSTVDNKPFELEDWNTVVIECRPLAAKWRDLSIYLGLSCDVIDNIKGSDNYHCWSEALKNWIKQNYNTKKYGVPSWRSLLRTVAKVDKLQFKNLARQHQAPAYTAPISQSHGWGSGIAIGTAPLAVPPVHMTHQWPATTQMIRAAPSVPWYNSAPPPQIPPSMQWSATSPMYWEAFPQQPDPRMGMGRGVAGRATMYELHQLHQTSARGDLEKVKELIEKGQFDPLEKSSEFGMNSLHYSAQFGQLGVLRYFIEERGCNPASQDNRAWTPLHYAAFNKHLDIVRYLVANQQMDPLCCADDGDIPLHLASQAGDINIVRYLVNELSKFLPLRDIVTSRGILGRAPIHRAAANGQLEIMKYFIMELKCNPNITMPVEYQGRTTGVGGRIALHDAAQRGHLHIVKWLVEHCNCNPSHLDNERVTPLHMAAQDGHLEVVQYLTLEQHCDPMCRDKKNDTPLHPASRKGHLQVVQFFIEVLHCPPDVRGQHNDPPLVMARTLGQRHVVEYLESIHQKL